MAQAKYKELTLKDGKPRKFIPPTRTWAVQLLDDFLAQDEPVYEFAFKTEAEAKNRRLRFDKTLRDFPEYAERISISKRGNSVFIEKSSSKSKRAAK